MKFLSEAMTTASGSIGGTTYSRNRYGMYRRSRATPVNPSSTNQQQVRAAMTELVTAWTDILTAVQRSAWDSYAAAVAVTDALGQPQFLTGQNWYIGSNTGRLQSVSKLSSTLTRVDDAPTIYNRGDFTDATFAIDATIGLAVSFSNTDAWANEDDAAMLISIGRPQNPSRGFYKGPWRLVGVIEGDSTTAPTSPKTIAPSVLTASGYTATAGLNYWIKTVVTRADGRYSSPRIYGPELCS